MTDTGPSSGATPQEGPDPVQGATPDGQQQQTDAGATPAEGSTQGATPDQPLADAGRQALDRERDARRDAERQLVEVRRQLREAQDTGKTEEELRAARLQRAESDLAELTAERDTLRAELSRRDLDTLRMRIAAEEGVGDLAEFIGGEDTRSIRDAAKKLAARRTPTGNLGIGLGGGATSQRGQADMNTLIRRGAGRE